MADRPASPSLFAATPLVGRGRERATLRAVLDAALAGRGGLVLVGGEAGIGKTALAEALTAEAAEAGALAVAGRCYDLSETPPYGPWLEALAHHPCDCALPPPDAPLSAPRRRHAAVSSGADNGPSTGRHAPPRR
ncbi:MAG TPA: AAA family ATPase [Thermomicrobiales bacterium]|nr:AAA family ATPase [Thermomicrobiales bacterium]